MQEGAEVDAAMRGQCPAKTANSAVHSFPAQNVGEAVWCQAFSLSEDLEHLRLDRLLVRRYVTASVVQSNENTLGTWLTVSSDTVAS